MVHNGVEYGMMQAYAEGFALFDSCEYELDNAKIAHLWMQGSVVRSWLCELAARAFEQEGNDLDSIAPYVEDSARAAGRSRTRSTSACRCRCSPSRCSPASAPAAGRLRRRR
jgi:6-phosphogluconate dehydrogenase (decarboxylating)